MKYSKALRESIKFRKGYPVEDRYLHCPLCDEVFYRNNDRVCLGCPLHHKEPSFVIFPVSDFLRCGDMAVLRCGDMADGIHEGDEEIEKAVLELALAYELAGD